jgi:hypothetical protein
MRKYNLKGSIYNTKIYAGLIYLGYFEEKLMKEYINKILRQLLNALSKKIAPLECYYTNYQVKCSKKNCKISLKYDDENNILKKIIINYLFDNGIKPIFENRVNKFEPMVDLLSYSGSSIKIDPEKVKPKEHNGNFPKKFTINSISLIKGMVANPRPGFPSLHDKLFISEIEKFPLNG